MREITTPYHLLIPCVFSFAVLFFIFLKRKQFFLKGKNKFLWICFTISLISYIFILGLVTFEDIYYQLDLVKYDLDGDGMFGGVELTEAQSKAMDKLTNDTGRIFAPLVGLIISGLFFLILFTLGKIYTYITKNSKIKNA